MLAVGAIGDDLLGDIVVAAMARHGVDTAGLIRKTGVQTSATILPIRPNGERPALHVPGATRLFTRADIDLERVRDSRALLVGAPDALAGMTGDDLAHVAAAARAGALVAVDVLHPGRPRDLERLAALLAATDWFLPNADQLLALTGRTELADAIKDVLALGTGGVAVTWARTAAWSPGRRRRTRDAARARGRGGGHHRLRRRLHRGHARRAAAGRRPGRRRLARPRLRRRWSPPASGRTPGSRASARCWTSSAGRSRPWPAGSRSTSA